MKKLLFFLLPALMLLAAGCKDKNLPEELPQTLSVNPELITCPDAGGDYTLVLTSPNSDWSAATNESWIRVTPPSGEKGTTEVRIKISPNKESAETKGEVTFTSGKETVQLPITRAAKAAPYLRIVSDIELNTPKEGGSYTVQIESNIKWSASSNAGWAKVNKGVSVNNDNITVTVSPATTPEETTATITIAPYGEGEAAGTQQVTITRGSTDATSLSVDPTEIKAPENGGSFTVNVSSNAKWRVYKTWDMSWLTLSGSQDGDGNGSFSFSIEEATSMDAVSGILTIEEDRSDNYKPVVTQVAVSRKGKAAADLTVAPIAINASAEGGNFPVAIKSNYPWTATASGNFFSLSSTSGDGYSTIVVSVNPATEEKEKTGYILINSSFGGEQARIDIHRDAYVKQDPANLKIYPDQLSAPAEGGEYVVYVTANCGWTVNSYDSRVATVEPAGGTGSGSFTVTVLPSTPQAVLRSYIAVTSEDGSVTQTITVKREKFKTRLAQKPFSVSSSRTMYFAPGNLLYTQSTGSWSFAEYQYEVFGLAAGVWELFGFGSGNDPTATTVHFNEMEDLDFWDSHPITYQGNTYPAGTWHLPTGEQWAYLLYSRTNASQLRGAACVKGVNGFVLLPDNWQLPGNMTFTANTNDYSANIYSDVDWIKMEANGAIFLPASGYRYEYALGETHTDGYYWSMTIDTRSTGYGSVELLPRYFHFYYNSATDNGAKMESGGHNFHFGHAVRLMKKAND